MGALVNMVPQSHWLLTSLLYSINTGAHPHCPIMIGTHLILVPQEEVMEVAQWGILHDHSRIGHFGDTTHHPDDIGVGSCRDLHHYCQLRAKVVYLQPHPLPWVENVREGIIYYKYNYC